MATYEDIYGKRVKEFDSDPTLDSSYEGQVWYNSATGTLKSVVSFSAWSAQPNTINNLGGGGSNGFGTSSTSALFTGGGPVPSPTDGSQKTEEWNGVGFEAKSDIPQTQNQMNDANMGFGTTTSGLVSGSSPGSGAINNWSQDWNGTSWEATPTMPTTGRGTAAGYGVLTAGLNIGGYGNPIPPGRLNRAEEYTGSTWTAGGTLSQARYNAGGGAGTQTSAAACGGQGPSAKESQVENYDGSSFTTGVALPQAIRGGRTAGTSDSAYIFWGGSAPPGSVGETLEFDGTAFTDLGADMGTAGSSGVCAGTTTSAINIMSGPPPGQNKTQQYNKSINTITPGAFASGGSMNNARRYFSGFGTQTAAVAHGGSPALSTVEHYNGSSWSNATAMPATYSGQGASGTQTSGLVFGGSGGPSNPGIKSDTFEYNGSSWTSGGAMVVARNINQGRSSAGTQTAALGFGGYSPGGLRSETEEYDGNSWTAGGALPAARNHGGGSGTQTSALAFGGLSPGLVSTGLAYDGSSWTSAPSLVYAVLASGSAGTSTSSIAMGGSLTVPLNTTNQAQGYDGSAWSSRPSMATARRYLSGVGTGTAALASGGSTGSDTTATEEFTGAISTVTAKTLTTG